MKVTITKEQWEIEAQKRYGQNNLDWRFQCPACGYKASTQDWKDAGLPSSMVAFSCIGRGMRNATEMRPPGPCNYAGGGLMRLNPITVTTLDGDTSVFDFADSPLLAERP